MTPPETRYAKSGELRIAYQVVGNGPLDLVFVPGFVSNLASVTWLGGLHRHYVRDGIIGRHRSMLLRS